ncbi:hypothetical protein N5J07_11940 [Comamonas aquatica]|uniref:hypothetical protein n=1 Tax=Comamonas aquatica TaxID=225991 RepID=UPI00244D5089|nr:hypothetical protein [Comamonas aquatica]MDH1380153.1 hypothetical protein [Comamonas aquatica]MDH1640708.1 hypothetical protein [Comamonas aquatica]
MTTDSAGVAKLRTEFEKLASDPGMKFARSPKGTYRNPALARDWKWFRLGHAQAEADARKVGAMWNALINFCIDKHSYDTVEILHLWREGCFQEIRDEWPEAPEEMFP